MVYVDGILSFAVERIHEGDMLPVVLKRDGLSKISHLRCARLSSPPSWQKGSHGSGDDSTIK